MADKKEYSSWSIDQLNHRIKELDSGISHIDSIIYGDKHSEYTKGKSAKWVDSEMQRLADSRYSNVRERQKLYSELRRRKLNASKEFNQKALNFGVYTDIHTPKIVPSAKGRMSAIRGISL